MKARLICILITGVTILLTVTHFFTACNTTASTDYCGVQGEIYEAILPLTEDAGEKYQNSLIFMGESTTYHLKTQKVLFGGENTHQVWANESGTMNLDMTTKNTKIIYPETKEKMTPAMAAAEKKPKYIVLTFGLNGAVQNVKRGKDYYISCYSSLISSLQKASPGTRIIIQSAFPVSSKMDMSKYTVDAKTLNSYIEKINLWSLELAQNMGLRYLNTSEILTDGEGYLRTEYMAQDGYHICREGYIEILKYIRTHAYI